MSESRTSTNAVSPGQTVGRLIYGTTRPTVGHLVGQLDVWLSDVDVQQCDLFYPPDGDT